MRRAQQIKILIKMGLPECACEAQHVKKYIGLPSTSVEARVETYLVEGPAGTEAKYNQINTQSSALKIKFGFVRKTASKLIPRRLYGY